MPGRLPDFIIIGAMKAGTTTLYGRLSQLEAFDLPHTKEPHFFSVDENWERGVRWYQSVFTGCDGITGEASTDYSDAAFASTVATRMSRVIPNVRLVYAIRQPVERLRSHYVHEVLRGREKRPLTVALRDSQSPYISRSLYASVLASYAECFPLDQIYVYRLEDLDRAGPNVWSAILEHIGAPWERMPELRLNRSAEKIQFTKPLLWLWHQGLVKTDRLPSIVRRAGRKLLTKDPGHQRDLMASSEAPIPLPVMDRFSRDQEALRDLGLASSLDPDLDP